MEVFAGVSLVLRKGNFLVSVSSVKFENIFPFSSLVLWEGVCAITSIPQFPVYILAAVVLVSVKR